MVKQLNEYTKIEVYQNPRGSYNIKFYELVSGQWRYLSEDTNYSKDALEFEYGVRL